MNAITPDLAVGSRSVDVSRGERRGEVSKQWATRPDDQKFLTLEDLFESCNRRRQASYEAQISPSTLRFHAKPDDSESLLIETNGTMITPTHYSFGQLCRLGGAPSDYIRKMHAMRAAMNLQADMVQRGGDNPVKLYGNMDDLTARAFTGPDYGRIYDADVVAAVQRFAGTGSRWKVPGQIDWSKGTYNPYVNVTKDTTTLYASDRDVFLFLVDDTHPISVGKLPNGDDDLIFRGFYAYNSEVGARAMGIATFWLRAVCQNRNLWGVEDFEDLKITHRANGPMRFARDAEPALHRYAESEPTKLLAGINAAKDAVIKEKEEQTKLLTGNGMDLSMKMALKVIETVEREEGHPPMSVWDLCQGMTAVARDIPNQDTRTEMEKLSAKLMNRAARNAT